MKRKVKNKFDERKIEIILLITLTVILIISLTIGHHFNKGTYHDGPNDTEKVEIEEKRDNQ